MITEERTKKLYEELQGFFDKNPEIAVAFSGGVDSSFLIYAAGKYASKVTAYYVKSAFQPEFELEDAVKLAEKIGCDMKILKADILQYPAVTSNPKDRCYHCKKQIFAAIMDAAAADGYSVIADGTNASDDAADRPGMKALSELKVLSPLRECGLTKSDIRAMSKEAGLFTWDKPAYACLATRIPEGEEITGDKLKAVEISEGFLFSLGLTDFRVRTEKGRAKLQVREDQLESVIKNRCAIIKELGKYYTDIVLDLNVRT